MRWRASSARRSASKRGTWYPPYLSYDEAITAAYAEPKGPVVVADPTDNAGGGAASDNTNIIRRLLERGMTDAAVGPVWDPVAVRVLSCGRRRRDHSAALRRQDGADLRPADRRAT